MSVTCLARISRIPDVPQAVRADNSRDRVEEVPASWPVRRSPSTWAMPDSASKHLTSNDSALRACRPEPRAVRGPRRGLRWGGEGREHGYRDL